MKYDTNIHFHITHVHKRSIMGDQQGLTFRSYKVKHFKRQKVKRLVMTCISMSYGTVLRRKKKK